MAVGAGRGRVANAGDDSVMRYDLRTRSRRFISVPDGPSKVVVRGNSVWVTSRESDHLARIDVRPSHGQAAHAGDPFALAVDPRFVWVTELGRDRVSRVAYTPQGRHFRFARPLGGQAGTERNEDVMTGLAPGTEFAGHLIDTVAGRGGMGVVYRATQLRARARRSR